MTQGLLSMLRNQGSVKEEHKINTYIINVQLKAKLRKYISKVSLLPTGLKEENELFFDIIKRVKKSLSKGIIPYGTRLVSRYIHWLMKDYIEKQNDNKI